MQLHVLHPALSLSEYQNMFCVFVKPYALGCTYYAAYLLTKSSLSQNQILEMLP